MCQFNGIVPSPDGKTYQIRFDYFPNAFTYSYPSSPLPNTTSGILAAGPSTSFDPLSLIQSLPSILSLAPEESRCLDRDSAEKPDAEACSSPFWKSVLAVRDHRFRLEGFSAWLGFFMHASAVFVILLIFFAEACIRWRPWWMRCQCFWAWYRRLCPLPKCETREEMDSVDEHVWDRVRLWFYSSLVLYSANPVVWGSAMGLVFCRTAEWLEYGFPMGTSVGAKMGMGYQVVGWSGVGVSFFVFLLVGLRWLLTRSNGSEGEMDQQMKPLMAGEGLYDEDV